MISFRTYPHVGQRGEPVTHWGVSDEGRLQRYAPCPRCGQVCTVGYGDHQEAPLCYDELVGDRG